VFESTVVGAIRSECYDPRKDGPGMVVDLHGYTQVRRVLFYWILVPLKSTRSRICWFKENTLCQLMFRIDLPTHHV
jgi:ABC-type phosphate/phosphonate transport system permease subunit